MRVLTALCLVVVVAVGVHGHGQVTIPRARTNLTVQDAGDCFKGSCFWFSQIVEIPGPPTVNDAQFRTFNIHVSSGDDDWSRTMPWRAPGTAPVLGSGCGVAGGSDKELPNGGIPPPGYKQGDDGLKMPATEPTVWKRGSIQEVAWGIFANHGGGYQYRLCKNDGKNKVTEECFQQTPLKFYGNTSTIRYAQVEQWFKHHSLPELKIPLVRVTEGVHPAGSEWARNPIPACLLCDQTECMKLSSWVDQQHCSQSCSGLNMTHCPPGLAQFPEPAAGLSGYYSWHAWDDNGLSGFKFNIVDQVIIPQDIEPGRYLMSWRWDCEQSRQIWQNCADIEIQ